MESLLRDLLSVGHVKVHPQNRWPLSQSRNKLLKICSNVRADLFTYFLLDYHQIKTNACTSCLKSTQDKHY